MTAFDISISAEVDDATAKAIEAGLNRFNETQVGPAPVTPLWAVCRDEQGEISGGLCGHVQWDWFAISMLWVREDRRGEGLGGRLLAASEDAARERGCSRFMLVTVTFQAPGFYQKHGYSEVARIPDFPPGHDYVWMTKRATR